jgi:hypothetical protein
MPGVEHRHHKGLNDRTEVSHEELVNYGGLFPGQGQFRSGFTNSLRRFSKLTVSVYATKPLVPDPHIANTRSIAMDYFL